MPSNLAALGRRSLAIALVAVTATAAIGTTDASAGVRRPAVGGFHGGMERHGFGHADFRRGGGRGFGGFGGGDFGDGRVAAGLGAATLALGIFGAVASAAAEQQAAAQPQCGIANQPVLRSNGTYYYRRVQVCQ